MSNFENIGVNSPAGADGTADEAYEMFKKGASIEEVNEKLFGTENGPLTSAPEDKSEANADGVTYEDNNNPSVLADDNEVRNKIHRSAQNNKGNDINLHNGAESDVNRALDNDYDDTGAAASEEKVFSQKELDNLVGRRIAKEKRAHDTVKADYDTALDEISKYLGVSREEALTSLKKANIRKEAEANDITDIDLYERLRLAEMKNSEYEDAERKRSEAQNVEEFKNTIITQIDKLGSAISNSDLAAASADPEFNSLVRYFYDNSITRGDCVSLAYNAYAKARGKAFSSPQVAPKDTPSDEGVSPANKAAALQADTTDNPPPVIKPRRVSENASSAGSAAPDTRMNVEEMKLADFDKIYERVKRGETIIP